MSSHDRFSDCARPAARIGSSAEALLLSVVDWGLSAVILAAPWFMGGRHPLGQFVLAALAVLVAVAWAARQMLLRGGPSWTRSPAEFLLAAAVALVLLQLTPLPASLLGSLSPRMAELLPLWQSDGEASVGLGSWNRVTMTPDATVAALVMLLTYGLLLGITVQRVRRVEDVEMVLRWLAISVVLLAVVAIAQYVAGNGKFLWIYQHPFRDTHDAVKGPFANKNHFAHLVALGLGPLVWLVHRTMSECRRAPHDEVVNRGPQWTRLAPALSVAALGVVLFAGLMTLSRGGVMAMSVAALVCVAALIGAGLLSKRFLMALAGALALIAAALTIHGYQRVATRMGDLVGGSIATLDRFGHRRMLWEACLSGCHDYYPLGSGIGSHRDVYPIYFSEPVELELTHAENGPLQLALEAGVPGLVLLLIGLALCGYWCRASLRRPASQRAYLCAAAVVASLAASVAHSLVDFVWYIPSLMAITIVLVGCALRLYQLGQAGVQPTSGRTIAISRWTCAAAIACIVPLGVWMIGNRFCATMAAPHWDRYMTYALTREASTGRAAAPDQTVFDNLRQVIHWTPGDARAHLRLSQACLRRFDQMQQSAENAMPLSQIRDAAVRSRFGNRAALDEWLSRAVGDGRRYLEAASWHARRALQSCPLQGEAYVYLGELCFLDGAPQAAKSLCIAQALNVRPHSGEILLAAGSDAALTGNLDSAVGYWRAALTKDRVVQIALSDLLVRCRIPVPFVVEQFQPRLSVARLLLARYVADGVSDTELAPLLEYYAQLGHAEATARSDDGVVELWHNLGDVYRRLHEPDQVLYCLQRAAEANPSDFRSRYALAALLLGRRQFSDAEEQLRWCIRRQPENQQVEEMMARAVRGRVAQSGTSQAREPAVSR
ncbi:MAG: O-antigen ligase family protein [Pirellulales bacterium]